MKNQQRGILQIIFLLVFVALLIRLFPLAIRIAESAALGIRQFWWMILILSLGGWLVWVLKKRNSG